MAHRCDKSFDCEDESDEEGCGYFEADPKRYNKQYPPITKGTNQQLDVKVNMEIESLQNIKELDMSFDAKFVLVLEWYDSRLRYKNLLKANIPNLVNEKNRDDIWIPPLVFTNTDDNVAVTDDMTKSIVLINKQAHHTTAPLTSVTEDYYYEGSENSLNLKMDYQLSFHCNFQLQYYPFDTQTCGVEVLYTLHL